MTIKQIIDDFQARFNRELPGCLRISKAHSREILINQGIITEKRPGIPEPVSRKDPVRAVKRRKAIKGTVVSAEWLNSTQDELSRMVESAGKETPPSQN